ncbi:MAG: hypothetical protein M1834_005373 [Cirrosporium novae-zelandiae]|nr:MAG: hypothetical protein M1834_005373 [Cirrosporium novae-zelandiae]
MDASGKPKGPSSAFESPTFGEDSSFRVQQPVGSMSISPCGRDVVLASRAGLHIVDLDSPYSPPRFLPHHTMWEVADVQWSPFSARDSWVVSTSNQKALVWNLEMKSPEDSIEYVLHGHSRAITDINFSAHRPEILATCAVDSFVHCWDLRSPLRPVLTFSDWFAGATQVKWNRLNPHIIASSHDKYLRIWDDRKGAYPLKSIEAHDTKIYGLDWNRFRETAIVTCSLDKTIKFWDYTNTDDEPEPERVIKTPFPVWRARYTPFGRGLLAMPQRGDNDLYLYHRDLGDGMPKVDTVTPAHSFPGHQDQVKEFVWRSRGSIADDRVDNREFQLVSWGKDQYLRLHHVDKSIMQSVGYEIGTKVKEIPKLSRDGAAYRTFRDDPESATPQGTSSNNYSHLEASRSSGSGMLGTGMNKIQIPLARSWIGGGLASTRTGMHGRVNVRQDANPIAWMRGVKIGRRDHVGYGRHGNLRYGRQGSINTHVEWDRIESLGDEITYVGDKFTRVDFESVNIHSRTATATMNGPWGVNGESIFIKVNMDFPQDYPEKELPKFTLEQTASLTEDIVSKITAEVKTISKAYVKQKQGCLEAVLRYLLGECDLENSIAWFRDEVPDEPEGLTEDVASSSDEDDGPGNFQTHGLDMSGSGSLGVANVSANVPIPKRCGAVWAKDGRLVCFFPPKISDFSLLSNPLPLKDGDRSSKSERIFEGFGRFSSGSPGPSLRKSNIRSMDDESSESSDDSFTSSSSSSSESSELTATLPDRYQPPYPWRGGVDLQQSQITDLSQRSESGIGLSRSTPSTGQVVVSLRNFQALLPAKPILAKEYKIFGQGPDVAKHNSGVAAKHGNENLAKIWDFIGLILHNKVPLTIAPEPDGFEDVLVMAKSSLGILLGMENGAALPSDSESQSSKTVTHGRVRWGQSPLGGRWFVNALFDHFERLGDVQMLAMMSCIFTEAKAEEHNSHSVAQLKLPQSLMPLQTPAFSIDYYPSPGVAVSLRRIPRISPTSNHPMFPSNILYESIKSPSHNWSSNGSTTPQLSGATPPTRLARKNSDRSEYSVYSLNPSPDQRLSRRGTSTFANAFKSFASAPSSPPAGFMQKRASPSGSILEERSANSGWETVPHSANPSVPNSNAPSNAPSSLATGSVSSGEVAANPNKLGLKLAFKNQNLFDDDGYASVPLLDPSRQWKYQSYRASYAALLLVWGFPLARTEILKFDGLAPYFVKAKDTSLEDTGTGVAAILRKKAESSSAGSIGGLIFRQHCRRCGEQVLEKQKPGARGKYYECKSCQRPAKQIPCSICEEVIRGLFVPCLECGHVTHVSCYENRLKYERNRYSEKDKKPECSSGCGCRCSEHSSIQLPWPESRNVSSDALSDEKNGLEKISEEPDGSDPWEKVNWNPLSRGAVSGLRRGLSLKASDPILRKMANLKREQTR